MNLVKTLVRSSSTPLFCHSENPHFQQQQLQWVRHLTSNRASIVRTSRLQYLRPYPTLLVNPDGSTITIRYHEPRQIVKLPFDISSFTEEEKKVHLERRKPKTRVKIQEDVEQVHFDSKKYLKYIKK